MAKKLTRYILIALVLGVIAGWAINAAIDDGTPASAERLKSIADYLSIVTALFLRLIKMIIAPLVFSTLVAGIAHMGDVAALGRVGVRSLGWFVLASLVSLTLGLILVTLLHPGVGLNLPLPPATSASGEAGLLVTDSVSAPVSRATLSTPVRSGEPPLWLTPTTSASERSGRAPYSVMVLGDARPTGMPSRISVRYAPYSAAWSDVPRPTKTT